MCSVDLDGIAVGAIKHNAFATTPSAAYTVSFLLSGDATCAPTVKTMEVKAAGQSQTFTWDISKGNDAQHGVFQAETWSFTAASLSTALEFASLDRRGSGCGAVIAAIAVTQN